MKFVVYIFTAVLFCSCSDSLGSSGSDGKPKPMLTTQQRKRKKLTVTGDGTPPKTAIHKATLVCKDIGESEFGVPNYEVYVRYDSINHKVGTCNACAPLDLQDYHDYEIPKNARAAVGGWFAGGGDYFYILSTKDDGIKVYAGWQDEGQMEDNDTSFHYKKVYEKHPDGQHKFF